MRKENVGVTLFCETRSLTLRKECRIKVFKNRILRRVFGPKRDAKGEWTKLNNGELQSLYRKPNIFKMSKAIRLRWASHISKMEEGRSAFEILAGKILLERPRRKWKANIRTDLKEIAANTMNWFNSAQDRGY